MKRCIDTTSKLDKFNYKIYPICPRHPSEKLETVHDDVSYCLYEDYHLQRAEFEVAWIRSAN